MAFLATELSDKINGYLSEMPYMREPKGLYAPIEYVLSLGGKRIRPVLMLLAYNMYKEDVDCICRRRQVSRLIIIILYCMTT